MDQEMEAKVSVIVAVYNSERYLRQCLDSIAAQTLREIEIICVNDGSTDGSLSILEEYANKDRRFRIFTKENEGLGGASARNYGLERARGEYVSILDSDDFFEPDMLEKAAGKADRTRADIVIFGSYSYDGQTGRTAVVPYILDCGAVPDKEVFSRGDCPESLFQITVGMAWNKLYRRQFLEKHRLRFQKIQFTDDAYFTYAGMALAERITVIPECFCHYRIHGGASQTDRLSRCPDSAYIPYLTLKESFVKWGFYEEVRRSFANCAAKFLRFFHDRIQAFQAFEYLQERYKNKIFAELDLLDHPPGYFYDPRIPVWIHQILENSAGELALKAARACGDQNTTAVLRFPFPYDRVPAGSRIVLIGDGDRSRYYCAQAVLSRYCDVVLWIGPKDAGGRPIHEITELRNQTFDYALVMETDASLRRQALSYLREIGLPEGKIVSGGGSL